MRLSHEDHALVELGRLLRESSYQFVTVTPETHRRVLARDTRRARDLRDVFGWSRSFERALLPDQLRAAAEEAGVLVPAGDGLLRANVRFSSLDQQLFVHSAFPTLASDSVFFGPDTYRFCSFLKRGEIRGRVVDVGCGSGVGGIIAAQWATSVVLADISPMAVRFARVNAALAGSEVEVLESDVLAGVAGKVDVVIANPPYMLDTAGRVYRDGGGSHGQGLALRIVQEALKRLEPAGRVLLYTGAPIVAGRDALRAPLQAICEVAGAGLSYEELDPDVFGEQLEEAGYEDVERIAAIGAVVALP